MVHNLRGWIALRAILHIIRVVGILNLCVIHVVEMADLDISGKICNFLFVGVGQLPLLPSLGSFSVNESWVLEVGKQGG